MANTQEFGIIKTGGKQYKVQVGDILKIEKLTEKKEKDTLQFKDILFGKTVAAEIVKEGKLPKVRVLKFHPKKRYKRVVGHRQNYLQIQIKKIS